MIGGLVGLTSSSISQSYSSGTVTGYDDVGGLIGEGSGTFSNDFTASPVTAIDGVPTAGGIVGYLDEVDGGALDNSYYDAAVTGMSTCTGNDNSICEGTDVDDGASNPTYFFNNDSNAPLSNWAFDDGDWIQHSATYPTFAGAPLAGDASMTATTTSTSITPTSA